MKNLLSTKQIAEFLNVNEKMIYSLVSEKGLPATKITGKWLFPRHLVERWVEANTINYPENGFRLPPHHSLLIIIGSNDPLLDKAISLFNSCHSDQAAVFGNLGSMGGLSALRNNLCHMASSHLLQEDESEYNFDFAFKELDQMPAVVNFCHREQGILLPKGNPKKISSVANLAQADIRIVNRSLKTGTRLLLDRELKKAGINGEKIEGYSDEVASHLDVGLAVLSGRADAGLGIRAIAGLLDLDFIPIRLERFDLMISKKHFFDLGIQRFLELLHDEEFMEMAAAMEGYDISLSGKMLFPANDGVAS